MLLLDTMNGKRVNRAPSVPKIWIDLAANLLGRKYELFFRNPEYVVQTVIEAAIECESDGARVFLFPDRDIREENGAHIHWKNGKRMGRVDMEGGWFTIFDHPADIDFSDPTTMICYQLFRSKQRIIKNESDISRLELPPLRVFHEIYGTIVEGAIATADGRLCLIGDCNSGTLAFCASMLGMEETLLGLYDNPSLLTKLMEKGIQLSITQAKFMLDKGLRVLRYNDSVANMNVISPTMWRTFVKPFIGEFCRQVHGYCADAKIYCHICGDVRPIVYDLMDTGLDCIAPLDPLGKQQTVGEIRAMVGDDYMLMGGVNTLSFINCSPSEIQMEAERCINEGFVNGGHYAVGSGCVVPRMTTPDALRALAKASRNKGSISIGG